MHRHRCMPLVCFVVLNVGTMRASYICACLYVLPAGVHHVLLLAGDNETPAGVYSSSLDVLSSGLLLRYGITQGL